MMKYVFIHRDMSRSIYEVYNNLDLINLLLEIESFEKMFKWSDEKADWVEVKRREV